LSWHLGSGRRIYRTRWQWKTFAKQLINC